MFYFYNFFHGINKKSGWQDLNLRPLAPHASALAKLRYTQEIKQLLSLQIQIRLF